MNQLSRPRQDDYKTGKVKVMHTKTKTNTGPQKQWEEHKTINTQQ